MNDTAGAPGWSLLPDTTDAFTAAHFAIIAVLIALTLVGIVWGARLKRRRKAAEREVRENNRTAPPPPADGEGGDRLG